MTERELPEKDVTEEALGIAREWRGKGSCVVSHPDAGGQCERPVARMVWNLLFATYTARRLRRRPSKR